MGKRNVDKRPDVGSDPAIESAANELYAGVKYAYWQHGVFRTRDADTVEQALAMVVAHLEEDAADPAGIFVDNHPLYLNEQLYHWWARGADGEPPICPQHGFKLLRDAMQKRKRL